MKLILDTADIRKIEHYLEYLPVYGVTTNPSIIKKSNPNSFETSMKNIKSLLSKEQSLHIQTVSSDFNAIIREAEYIIDKIGNDTYIKVPVTIEGLKAIKYLKDNSFNVTATAIYNEIQAQLAIGYNVDFLAPYVNRMLNLDTDPFRIISRINSTIVRENKSTEILGASFKNITQVLNAYHAGANYLTVGVDVVDKFLDDKNINYAIEAFASDWKEYYGNQTFDF